MDLLNTYIKIGVKDETTKEAQGIFDRVSSMGGKLAKGLAALGVVSAIKDMGAAALQAGADYEQLVGGVETLFGASADTMKAYADEAYKTAGLSKNQYMEQATSFAASLVSSLGGDAAAAAEYANLAMVDMSDNANKMGTDMEAIQNAYQGFSKQNYTMLDNLKLGYGGTKQEMERLLKDAEDIKAANGEMASYSVDSFSDIVEAIHVVQENMGVTGTTAKEAEATVSGSIGMMKSAWGNLVTDFSVGGANMQGDLEVFVGSLGVASENVFAMLGTIVENVGVLIAEQLPVLAQNAVSYIQGNGPAMLQAAIGFFCNIVAGIGGALPSIIAAVPQIVFGIVETIVGSRGQLMSAAGYLVQGIVDGLGQGVSAVVNKIKEICSSAVDAVKSFFGIHSPSRVMRDLFYHVPEGAALGIEDGAADIMHAWDSAMSGIGDVTATVGVSAVSASAGSRRGGSSSVIAWLDSNLPAIIERYTPTVGERDFARMARRAVAYA